MNEKTFQTKNCSLNFFEHNIGAKESILFIHGWTAGWEVWINDIEKYGSKYNIYAVDLPGHNKSGKLKCLSIIEDIDDLNRIEAIAENFKNYDHLRDFMISDHKKDVDKLYKSLKIIAIDRLLVFQIFMYDEL